jgi:ComF family protein
MVKMLDGVMRVAADLLFPPQCALCGAGGTLLCQSCEDELTLAPGSRCARCFDLLDFGSTCVACKTAPPRFIEVRAAYSLRDGARQLVHLLKYDNLSSIGTRMGAHLAHAIEFDAEELIVPVPLHRSRERERSYNQAELIARGFANDVGAVPLSRALKRVRATEPLARGTSKEQRKVIVAGAFKGNPTLVDHRRVVLIDDVVTTGATLDACAAALLEAGALQVRCATWARADWSTSASAFDAV